MTKGGQKFIGKNRAPRVQIEYDVELYGAEKKVQLPFVMGVLSDLSGKAEKPAVDDRKFLEIDADNFDERMRGMAPRATFTVPNTLTGEGNLPVDLTFEKMDDFSPAAIAERVSSLKPLLEARTQLSNLMAYMDGKSGAEALIEKILNDSGLLQAVAGGTGTGGNDHTAALDALRAAAPMTQEQPDDTKGTLDALRAAAPDDAPETDETGAALDALRSAAATEDAPPPDTTASALDALRENQPDAAETVDGAQVALDALRAHAPTDEAPVDDAAGILGELPTNALDAEEPTDTTADILSGIETTEVAETPDQSAAVLQGLAAATPTQEPVDTATDVLSELAEQAPQPAEPEEISSDILNNLSAGPADEPELQDDSTDVLAALADEAPVEMAKDDDLDALLGAIEAPDEVIENDGSDVLIALSETVTPEVEDDDLDALLGTIEAPEDKAEDEGDDLDALLGSLDAPAAEAEDNSADVLDALADTAPVETVEADDLDALLGSIEAPQEVAQDSDLDDLLGSIGASSDETETKSNAEDDLDAMLADLGDDDVAQPEAEVEAHAEAPDDSLDALLDGLDDDPTGDAGEEFDTDGSDDLDALLGDSDDSEGGEEGDAGSGDIDLDDLLAGLDDDQSEDQTADEVAEDDTDLDALLAGLEDNSDVSDHDGDDDLDALLAGISDDAAGDPTDEGAKENAEEDVAALGENGAPDVNSPFGYVTAPRPSTDQLNRKRFRMAILGDFTGRSVRGQCETGDALVNRSAKLLDVDTVEDLIESFATTLVLPIGKDGAGIEVKLGGLDDLHPDELYNNVEMFQALSGLRQRLSTGSMAEKATQELKSWGEAFGKPVKTPKRSASTSIPADRPLSAFQSLIGDTAGTLTQASPADDIIARIVGPHVVAAPDPGAAAMQAAVDEAIGSAMRLILHHPDFQAVEAQWRSLDLLARRVETDNDLEIVLYDVSAQEIATDLAAQDDLSDSGLLRLLTEGPLDEEEGRGGFSAVFGLYSFEETPPHAELLARVARVAAHIDAPFFTALSPAFLETAKADRHPLVAKAWDSLRGMAEAKYLGLVSPRFMLRRPYGAKSDPIYAFSFEEFTMHAGLSGMLWANPVVLVAILLAGSFKKDGKSMSLGSVMSLGDIPFHFVDDKYGDQVALPCTERNLTTAKMETAITRGLMPVLSIKGRDEIRLGSFQALGGGEILGPWLGNPTPEPPSPRQPNLAAIHAPGDSDEDTTDDDPETDDDDTSLDDLLAGFADDDDEEDDSGDDSDIDAELAALLEGL